LILARALIEHHARSESTPVNKRTNYASKQENGSVCAETEVLLDDTRQRRSPSNGSPVNKPAERHNHNSHFSSAMNGTQYYVQKNSEDIICWHHKL
uniref:Uncharacterized protein n=1 Tax=Anisakis simplex TaxID=6269 RepID=A0A0M3JKU1_ANISI